MSQTLRCNVLFADEPLCRWFTPDGVEAAVLHRLHYHWQCADGALRCTVWSVAPLSPLASEPSEPRIGALARLRQAHAYPSALLCIHDGPELCKPQQALSLDGIRFCRLSADPTGGTAAESWWTDCLGTGLLIYACAEAVQLELGGAVTAQAVIDAMAFGAFITGCGPGPVSVSEAPGLVRWQGDADARTTVIAGGGFDVASFTGDGEWRESGHEGIVRLLFEQAGGRWWSQPRLVGRPGTSLR